MAENKVTGTVTSTEKENDYILQVKNLTKLYGANKAEAAKMMKEGKNKDEVFRETGVTVALWDVSFKVKRGEVFVIIGLSGSGKSTVVRMLNMLNKPTSGQVIYEDSEIDTFSKKDLNEYRRDKISMVFQSFGLMSHRDVLGNVAYGLEVKGIPRVERERRATEIIEMVGLKGHEHTSIGSLSGGMRQRVGIARALANDPEVLLMDEPFSALDPLVRKDMQFELLSIQRKLEKTVVFITHDINEAFKLGDTVAIMRDGRLIQVGTPEEMSANPADDYVREFINSADMTKVLCAKHVMIVPCVVRATDSPEYALREMKSNGVSTAYVVDRHMKFLGIVNVEAAIRARREEKSLKEVYVTDVATTTKDTVISDILPIAAEAKYPIAVLEADGSLVGIVSKASVLSSLM
ncbi:glycine betaine/L-proline ABC transporter ATP-binding protein [[Clostridium] symbiosum]|uniref:quaternary amine ABC transporter ATP-binding protein n=1 Tax=Clostridium symbiosum TaxID=1512 RepID=UPI001D068502|nr:glycine betaine/L-proline ABC transporter ATP-binding protein [[Clostridium] symbiosum]MCB6610248.1 glycine betaine/L-proline ABC transporter ATP-binding protein [[Clostridium] symbiosum]MCB6929462.1 glycine betaine/L-proline ABC transporter ATP-binding protein [[Clostridium] symbiosum]